MRVSRMSGSQAIPPVTLENQMPHTMMPTTRPRLIQLRPGMASGFEAILPESLPHATRDPVKVSAPMNTPIQISESWKVVAASPSSRKAPKPMSTAARPTKECSWAMSSGIPVISTLTAFMTPMAPPMIIGMKSSSIELGW